MSLIGHEIYGTGDGGASRPAPGPPRLHPAGTPEVVDVVAPVLDGEQQPVVPGPVAARRVAEAAPADSPPAPGADDRSRR